MGWRIYDEAIEMVQRRYRFFPRIFRWRGQRCEVESVERYWTVSRPGRHGRVERHFFSVRCVDGDLELYQDAKSGTWHLRRARLAGSRLPSARAVAAAWR